jgi:hypothetical protein
MKIHTTKQQRKYPIKKKGKKNIERETNLHHSHHQTKQDSQKQS